MLIQQVETKMPKHKPQSPVIKEFSSFLKVSGYKGGIGTFAKEFLGLNKSAVYYQLRTHGSFDTAQIQIITEQMKNGKNRQHGIKDAALPLLEKILNTEIPRAQEITVKGDNVAINGSQVYSANLADINYKELYETTKSDLEEAKKEITELKIKVKALTEILRGNS